MSLRDMDPFTYSTDIGPFDYVLTLDPFTHLTDIGLFDYLTDIGPFHPLD